MAKYFNSGILVLIGLLNLSSAANLFARFMLDSVGLIVILSFSFSDVITTEMNIFSLVIVFMCWVGIFVSSELHCDRIRYATVHSIVPIIKACVLLSFGIATTKVLILEVDITAADPILIVLFFNYLYIWRVCIRQFVRWSDKRGKPNLVIFGVSDKSIELANTVSFGQEYNVIGFLGNDVSVSGARHGGFKVFSTSTLSQVIRRYNVDLVMIDETDQQKRSKIIQILKTHKISMINAPTWNHHKGFELKAQSIGIDELIGRPTSEVYSGELQANIQNKVVLITGGGGSIGSEICRQIYQYSPSKIIIMDASEYNLYLIEQYFSGLIEPKRTDAKLEFILGSVTDKRKLQTIFANNNINYVIHAAAYKHVPLLEENVISGVDNNVIGTMNVVLAAKQHKVESFVLVSTDKAVRPTNVMGATKRLAELVVLANGDAEFKVSIVRFGNVLGSSGSVIPKFIEQINHGGPLTITHPEVTRYFMSIPEAANLVLHSNRIAAGGEVFLLDMGNPVKIVDLACNLIRMYGMQPSFPGESGGNKLGLDLINIEYSGLRPGEKLYEELLIEGTPEKTDMEKIYRAVDSTPNLAFLTKALVDIQKFINEGNSSDVINLLNNLPLDYCPNKSSKVKEKQNFKKFIKPEINFQSGSLTKENRAKSIHRVLFSKLLHMYFFMSRGMTIGTRLLVTNKENEVLLVKHRYLPGWHFPGGGVDHKETIYDAAVRELHEETGIEVDGALELTGIYLNDDVSSKDHVVCFRLRTNKDVNLKVTLEISDAKFFPLSDLPVDIDPTTCRHIKELLTSSSKGKIKFGKW